MRAGGHDEVDEAVVLVTAFGPFPTQPSNPTEAIADALAGEEHVVAHVLDVSFTRSVEQLDALVRMLDPVAVVSFGVAAEARGVRVETVARNRGGTASPDVDGVVGSVLPMDDGPQELPTRLPVDAILDALEAAGIPTEPSDDAGTYVCNHLFRALVVHPLLADRPVGFVHVPAPEATPAFDRERIALAGRIVTEVVAAHARGDL